MDYLIKDNWKFVELKDDCFHLSITPFEYNDGRKPRLPRKRSDGYDLMKDVEYYFSHVFGEHKESASSNKFKIDLTVNCGQDRLGTADLDNYCKALLDGITKTKKVWNDDKQIDELNIKRIYCLEEKTTINLIIEPINRK